MNANMKKALFVIGGIVAVVVIALVVFVATFDINSYKPRIEAAASGATGMDVRINGGLKLTVFPGIGLSIENIVVQNRAADVVTVREARAQVGLISLLGGRVRILKLGLISPEFFIARDGNGRFNFERTEKKPAGKGASGRPFEAKKFYIEKGRLHYTDQKTGSDAEAGGCGLSVANLVVGGGAPVSAASFDADLSCREVRVKGVKASDVRVAMNGHNGKFVADPVTMKVFGGAGRGSAKGAIAGGNAGFKADFAVTKFRFEEVLASFKQKRSINGEMNVKVSLAADGSNIKEITGTARGTVSLRGHDLVHESIDLDQVLKNYGDSQKIGLVDIGAFLAAGPLGPLLTKSYDFGSVYTASLGGKSGLRVLVSDWKVTDGVAVAEDVAFATAHNRVAVHGALDFVNGRFDDVTVAVLDEKGCAKFSQKIHGDFRKPRIEKVSTLKSLAGPVISILEKTGKILGAQCTVFYDGSVAQPE